MPIYSPDIFCFRIKMAATTTTVTSTPFTDIGTINEVAGTPCTPGWSPPPGPSPGPGYTPPLDTYTGAAAGYSVRLLSTAYKTGGGMALRVRRTVAPFDEQDIGFTPAGDLDEVAISAFGGSDLLTVSAWYDQSGFSRHLSMATAGSQPHIYDGASVYTVDGKPSVQFNGTDFLTLDGKTSSFTNWLESADGFSHYVVAQKQNNSTQFISGTPSAGSQTWNYSSSPTSSFIRFGGNTALTFNYINGSFGNTIFTTDYNDTTGLVTALKDGELSSNSYTSVASDTYFFNAISRFSSAYTGGVSEAIIYLSTRDSVSANIQSDINTYYTAFVNPDAATSGFLFDYPNAAAAYSVRQLNNNADYCMQVQRSDGRTLNVGFVAGELDTQAIIDFAGASSATVSRWFDQSGFQNHVNAANQPEIYNGSSILTENGKPALEFTSDTFGIDYPFAQTGSGLQDIYISSVARYTDTTIEGNVFGLVSGSIELALGFNRNATSIWGTRDKTGLANHFVGGTYDQSQSLFTQSLSGTTYSAYRNGTAAGGGYTSKGSLGNLIGSAGDQSGWFHIGTMQELVFFDADRSADRTSIESDTMTYYSIP